MLLSRQEAERQVKVVVGRNIEQQLASKFQPIQDRIIMIGRVSECEARIHTGFRSGLVELNTIVRETKDANVREFAQSTLTATGEGYESAFQGSQFWTNTLSQSQTTPPYAILANWMFQSSGKAIPVSNLGDVVHVINEEGNLNNVAAATLVFRNVTGEKNIKMFDFAAVNKWCASHEPQCKPPTQTK
jgi:hypothetical protein